MRGKYQSGPSPDGSNGAIFHFAAAVSSDLTLDESANSPITAATTGPAARTAKPTPSVGTSASRDEQLRRLLESDDSLDTGPQSCFNERRRGLVPRCTQPMTMTLLLCASQTHGICWKKNANSCSVGEQLQCLCHKRLQFCLASLSLSLFLFPLALFPSTHSSFYVHKMTFPLMKEHNNNPFFLTDFPSREL